MNISRNFSKVLMAVLVTVSMFVNLAIPANMLLACDPCRVGTSLKTCVCAKASWAQIVKYDWEITKTVNESSATLASDEEKNFDYTVTATRIPTGIDSQATVAGSIEVTNTGDRPTENLTVKAQVLYKTKCNKDYEPLTELQVIATDVLSCGEKKAYPYSLSFTPVENASYKVQTYTKITNYSGKLGQESGPETAAKFSLPCQPAQTVEDASASVDDEMNTEEMNTLGFAISSTGTFPWIVAETNLVVGEDGIGRAEQNYTVTVTNNSAENNKTFTLDNTAALTESSTNETHEASQAVIINTENNQEAEGGTLDSTVSVSSFWNQKLVYDWAITKTAEPASLSLAPGSSGTVNYILHTLRTLTEDSVEVRGVAGILTVKNTGNAATENLQINVQVMAKNGTEDQEIAGAAQMITPAQQLAAGEEGNYDYNINFIPVPGAEYKVVARMTIDNYAGQKSVPYGPSIEQPFTLPVAPEETREDHTAVVNDQVSSLEGFSITGGLTNPWELTEADLVVDEKGQSATKNYSVTITNTSAQANSTFELNNIVTLTEDYSQVERKTQAKVIIVTPEEDSDDATTKPERKKKRSSNKASLPTEGITPPQDEAPMTPQLPTEGITPPQDEAPMPPNNMGNLPLPEKNPADENPVPQEEINPPVQKEPQLPYTGGPTGLFVTMGMMLVLYGNRLRRK